MELLGALLSLWYDTKKCNDTLLGVIVCWEEEGSILVMPM